MSATGCESRSRGLKQSAVRGVGRGAWGVGRGGGEMVWSLMRAAVRLISCLK